MGKIYKALEKLQQSDGNDDRQEDIDFIKNEPAFSDDDKNASSANKVTHDEMTAEVPVKVDPMLVAILEPQSVEAEQFRLLKNSILFPEKGNPPRCIMITSSSPGEGKSFVAANLALSLSQNIDEHVLLLDCDLRSPSIHSLFGLDETQGLSEYLSESRPLSSLFVKTFLKKLTLLTAGKKPPNPSELLSSEQMRMLIHELKVRYKDRYIIIDTPPPHLTSETSVISRQVDGIVIVVQQGRTQKKDIQSLIDIYGRDKIVGVVYNFAKKPFGYVYGKYGYSYGYGVKNA